MTIDEKIKQAAEKQSQMAVGEFCKRSETQVVIRVYFVRGANFVKSEMLADMQKLADALEMIKISNPESDHDWTIAHDALAKFNAKYNKGEK